MTQIVPTFLVAILIACGYNARASIYEPTITEECKKLGICENVPNYPAEEIKKIINNLGDEVKDFQMDAVDDDLKTRRQGGGPLTVDLCNRSYKSIIYPEAAQDKDDKWYTVLNVRDKPVQGFNVEICMGSESCNPVAQFEEGFEGSCVQKYVYRTMSVVNKDGNHFRKSLKVPSCCSCVIKVIDFIKYY